MLNMQLYKYIKEIKIKLNTLKQKYKWFFINRENDIVKMIFQLCLIVVN